MKTLAACLFALTLVLVSAGCGNGEPALETPEDAPDHVHKGRKVSEWAKDLDSAVEKTRNLAVYELKELGPKAALAIPALDEALTHDDFYMRRSAGEALAAIGAAALPTIEKALEDGRLVDDALEGLGALREAGSALVPAIFRRAVKGQKEHHEKTVWMAANALEEIGGSSARHAAEQCESPDPAARIVATVVLRNYKTGELRELALKAVRSLLSDSDEGVREATKDALEWLGEN